MQDKKIVEILMSLKLPMSNLGFKYIVTAVKMVIADESKLRKITGPDGMYGVIAKEYNSTPSRVERAIRHEIEIAFSMADKEVLKKYFGHPDGKETNKNFIAVLAYQIISQEVAENNG
ncbi:sporulation initiation factor Spo0A C-terminal domain-containing protein [Anaerocolumna sp. AGMB13025]|uniref:sporulation initiation factor Spo0A C-terminal domain-containing protein n=1 Tax=Anaerocolumna sp. AGMB13025 TaxID=3039116 RepID=UPI00241E557B|nr:sporulation initiation factor Spo0A C-terminal domain-containing protein [Anaerocolumna sp. AGMB13025]WFR56418.1 sporulation initiation factor Spo0A C-terminal domain-containing protein [Anaerocolumna sp. AGMB13025]